MRVGFFGTGLIARYIHTYLAANDFTFTELGLHDISAEHSKGFQSYLERTENGRIVIYDEPEDLIRASDLIVFATVASQPHIKNAAWFDHNPLVLHISLRDLSPEIIRASYNVVDDVEHCLKANTSVHLAEQQTGNRDFIDGTLYDALNDQLSPPTGRTVIFSPFGLGILDLTVAKYVYDEAKNQQRLIDVEDFFYDLNRY